MEWYWWVLIVVAVVVGGYFKLKIFKAMTGKKKSVVEEED